MTKKDYVLLAGALRRRAEEANDGDSPVILFGIELATYGIADALASDNPRFDRDRFLSAALVEEIKMKSESK